MCAMVCMYFYLYEQYWVTDLILSSFLFTHQLYFLGLPMFLPVHFLYQTNCWTHSVVYTQDICHLCFPSHGYPSSYLSSSQTNAARSGHLSDPYQTHMGISLYYFSYNFLTYHYYHVCMFMWEHVHVWACVLCDCVCACLGVCSHMWACRQSMWKSKDSFQEFALPFHLAEAGSILWRLQVKASPY